MLQLRILRRDCYEIVILKYKEWLTMGFDRTPLMCPICGKYSIGVIAARKHMRSCRDKFEKMKESTDLQFNYESILQRRKMQSK